MHIDISTMHSIDTLLTLKISILYSKYIIHVVARLLYENNIHDSQLTLAIYCFAAGEGLL